MNENYILLLFISILIIFCLINYNNTIYSKSTLDNKLYKVQKIENYTTSANNLSILKKFSIDLIHKINNNDELCKKLIVRINRAKNIIQDVPFSENTLDTDNTSYTINKGEEVVLCLRSKIDRQHHDINIIKYILIHELGHIICPETGHTPLFYKINKYLLNLAIQNNLYNNINYKTHPVEYCGIELNEQLL